MNIEGKSPFVQGRTEGEGDPEHGQVMVISITLEYCDRRTDPNGEVKRRTIEVSKEGVGGFFWTKSAGDSIKDGKIGEDESRIPGPPPTVVNKGCGIPPGGASCCWWNGSEWVCPPDLD